MKNFTSSYLAHACVLHGQLLPFCGHSGQGVTDTRCEGRSVAPAQTERQILPSPRFSKLQRKQGVLGGGGVFCLFVLCSDLANAGHGSV